MPTLKRSRCQLADMFARCVEARFLDVPTRPISTTLEWSFSVHRGDEPVYSSVHQCLLLLPSRTYPHYARSLVCIDQGWLKDGQDVQEEDEETEPESFFVPATGCQLQTS